MKRITAVAILALLATGHAQAQSTVTPTIGPEITSAPSTAVQVGQSADSKAASFGTQTFEAAPGRTTSTVLNVSAPALAAFAAGGSAFNCYGVKAQAYFAGPGVSLGGGAGSGMIDCQQGWVSNDFARQALTETDSDLKKQDQQIAFNIRCMVNSETYDAIMATADMTGSRKCMVKPKDYKATQAVTVNTSGTKTYATADTSIPSAAGN